MKRFSATDGNVWIAWEFVYPPIKERQRKSYHFFQSSPFIKFLHEHMFKHANFVYSRFLQRTIKLSPRLSADRHRGTWVFSKQSISSFAVAFDAWLSRATTPCQLHCFWIILNRNVQALGKFIPPHLLICFDLCPRNGINLLQPC